MPGEKGKETEVLDKFYKELDVAHMAATGEVHLDPLNLTPEQAREIVYEDTDRFPTVHNEIVDTGRWSVHHEVVVHDILYDKYYRAYYSVGATEMQDERPFEYDKPDFREVKKVEVTTFKWEAV